MWEAPRDSSAASLLPGPSIHAETVAERELTGLRFPAVDGLLGDGGCLATDQTDPSFLRRPLVARLVALEYKVACG